MNKLLYISIVLLIGFTSCSEKKKGNTSESSNQSVYYFDYSKVYDEFTLTTELDAKLKQVNAVRVKELDSLQNILYNLAQKELTGDDLVRFNNRKQHFLILQEKFGQEEQERTMKYHNDILLQLESFIEQYRKEKSIDILISESDQTRVFGNPNLDLTQGILTYVNRKYAGE